MTEPTEGVIAEIINALREVEGIDNVPLNPGSVMSYPTFGLVYPGNGTFVAGAPTGTKRGLHNISVDVLTKNIDFARCIREMKPYIDTVSMRFTREVSYDSDGTPGGQFNKTMETFSDITYAWVPMSDYGGVAVIGLHFSLNNVKILTNL